MISVRRGVGMFVLGSGISVASQSVFADTANNKRAEVFKEADREENLVLVASGATSLFSFGVFVRPESRRIIKKADPHALCKALLAAHTKKRVELVFAEKTNGSALEKYFTDRLSKRLDRGELSAFAGLFRNQTLSQSTRLYFSFIPDSEADTYEVRTRFNNVDVVFHSDSLARGVLELFLLDTSSGVESSAQSRKERFLHLAKEMSTNDMVLVA